MTAKLDLQGAAWHTTSHMAMAATHFRIVGEPSTDELGRIAIHVEVSPPGEIVDVSWSPVGAHASAGYGGWGCAELAVLRRAIDEASRYMHEHPEKRALLRAGLRST